MGDSAGSSTVAIPGAKPGDHGADDRSIEHKLAVGHQELDRFVDEVEQVYESVAQAGVEWLSVNSAGQMVQQLNDWYEDFDEMEDAVGGNFEAFLRRFPQFELRANPEGKGVEFKVLPPDPDAPPTMMTLHVETRQDLWRVLYKSPDASIRIPHLEFEIGADSKRRIDTVYNHITNAVWNLSAHVRSQSGGTEEMSETAASVLETVDALEQLLDINEPWDLVVDDPTGASQFKPSEGIEVVEM